MKLSQKSYDILTNELKSCTSIISLISKIKNSNSFSKSKISILCLEFILLGFLTFYLIKYSTFNILFETLSSISLTLGVGLVALIIAGFAILIPSLSKENILLLLLARKNKKKTSFSMYTSTILNALEPMLWFSILIFASTFLKVLFLIKDIIPSSFKYTYSIKYFVIFVLLFLIFAAINSLFYFILNMYNFFVSHANFILLEKKAEDQNKNIDYLINKNIEAFNNSSEKDIK